MENTNKKTPRMLAGIVILMVSNIIVKVFGLLLKIPLHELLGDLGMSYFNISYNIFSMLYMISTAGLPVALSILISESRAKEDLHKVKRIFNVAIALFLGIGVIGTAIMLFGANGLSHAVKSPASYYCIMAISPALFFICISSALRGYFQGHQNMLPTAVSEIFESVGKLAIGISLAWWGIKSGYSIEECAALAILGVTIGVIAGTLFLCVTKFLSPSSREEKNALPIDNSTATEILKRLIIIAIPITISSVALNLTSLIDTFTVTTIMSYSDKAEELYGNYSTLVVTLFHLPSALIYPISAVLTPTVTAAVASGDSKRASHAINSAFKIASIISIPCALGMGILAKPILLLLFSNVESVNIAAPLLTVLSIAVFFTGILSISTSILQAHKKERKPVISMLCGAAVKLIFNIALMSIPAIGIMGAPIGTVVAYFVMVAVNLSMVIKYTDITPKILRMFIKPLIAGIICAGSAYFFQEIFYAAYPRRFTVVLSILLAALVYLLVLFLIKAINKEDIMMLPMGKKIYPILKKIKLMK